MGVNPLRILRCQMSGKPGGLGEQIHPINRAGYASRNIEKTGVNEGLGVPETLGGAVVDSKHNNKNSSFSYLLCNIKRSLHKIRASHLRCF